MAKIGFLALIAASCILAFVSAQSPVADCAKEHFGTYNPREVAWSALEPRFKNNEEAPSCYAKCVLERIQVLKGGSINISALRNTGVDIDDRLDHAAASCQISGASGPCGEGREAALCLYKALDKGDGNKISGDRYSSDIGLGLAIKNLVIAAVKNG